jgi:hypothetical protein
MFIQSNQINLNHTQITNFLQDLAQKYQSGQINQSEILNFCRQARKTHIAKSHLIDILKKAGINDSEFFKKSSKY